MIILLFFRFVPFFLANSLFRICAFALIIVFLDWWSVIPFGFLLFLNLVKFKSHIFLAALVVLKYLNSHYLCSGCLWTLIPSIQLNNLAACFRSFPLCC